MSADNKKSRLGWVVALGSIALISLFGLLLWWRVNWLGYQVYVPSSIIDQPTPVLVVLHGTGGDARTTQNWLGFDKFAAEYGMIVVYPHSPDGQWDAGAGVVVPGQRDRVRRDDVDYVLRIIEQVTAAHRLARAQVFLIGISDGAALAVRLSCELDGRFAGLASVAATIPVYADKNCAAANPLAALLIHGTQDTVLPWIGKSYRGIEIYRSLEASVDWWQARNACAHKSVKSGYEPYAGQVYRWRSGHCAGDSAVVVYRVNDGGHTWPGREHPHGRTSGGLNRDIDATALIVQWIRSRE